VSCTRSGPRTLDLRYVVNVAVSSVCVSDRTMMKCCTLTSYCGPVVCLYCFCVQLALGAGSGRVRSLCSVVWNVADTLWTGGAVPCQGGSMCFSLEWRRLHSALEVQ